MDNRNIEQIKQDMLNNVSNTEDKSENSLIHDALAPASIEFFTAYRNLENAQNKLDVENLEGGELDRYIYQRTGIDRKLATYAEGAVEITATESTRVDKGLIVLVDELEFEVQESKIVGVEGTVTVKVKSLLEGSAGNVPSNTINQFQEVSSGLIEVTNSLPTSGGYDEENDVSLLERYYERVRTPATSGNKYHYVNWAKEVEGVGDARVIPLWNGDNTVKIIIINSDKEKASAELIEKVQEHIDPNVTGTGEGQAPIGAFATVVSATEKLVNISATISKDSSVTLTEVKESIELEVNNYLREVAFKESVISYAKIGTLIFNAKGVLDYTGLKVNLGTSNISVTDDQVAMLGDVVLSE